jgi:hypothetical protein
VSNVIVLIATIPARRRSVMRLFDELTRQTRKPDGVILVLDGYGQQPPPPCPLPVVYVSVTDTPAGAGNRWKVVERAITENQIRADDIILCLDDDITLLVAPKLVEKLLAVVEKGAAAAAAMGRRHGGRAAPPGVIGMGELIHAAGCGLMLPAGTLAGVGAFGEEVKAAGGPDALGLMGDDDALVSAFLWKQGVKVLQAGTGNIYPAPGTQESSQTRTRRKQGGKPDVQKHAIKKATGWPWVDSKMPRVV